MKNAFCYGTLAVTVLFVGCSGKPPVEEVEVEAPKFKVVEAAPGGREMWLDNPHTYAIQMGKDNGFDAEKYYYYTGDAKGTSKRLTCEKAHANVVDDIAKQVATFVDTAISRASNEAVTESSEGHTQVGDVSEETERISSQLSKVQLTNIKERRRYWEMRDYSESGGAKSIYYCWVLVYVDQKEIDSMVRRASQLRLKEDADLKAKVQDKLQHISEDYNQYQKSH